MGSNQQRPSLISQFLHENWPIKTEIMCAFKCFLLNLQYVSVARPKAPRWQNRWFSPCRWATSSLRMEKSCLRENTACLRLWTRSNMIDIQGNQCNDLSGWYGENDHQTKHLCDERRYIWRRKAGYLNFVIQVTWLPTRNFQNLIFAIDTFIIPGRYN